MKYKYSIIIPHHEIPQLLKRAISSIPRRADLEVIVVDDASSSKYIQEVKKICSNLCNNIRLIELKENGGGGVARNIGLKYAQGEYILFLDADDFFNECINEILEEYSKYNPYEIIFFKGNSVDSETMKPMHRLDYLNNMLDVWTDDKQRGEELLRYSFGVPVCKIIRKSVIDAHQLKFDETRIHNDTTFAYKLGYYAKKIYADNRFLYCATERKGSVSKQTDPNLRLVTINILGRSVLFFRRIGKTINQDQLCFNLYILLRNRNYIFFKKGFEELEKIGFAKKDVERMFSEQMAMDSYKSSIWIILFSPILKIRMYSIKNIIKYSLFKYHGIKKN